jgi:hypothetical protein
MLVCGINLTPAQRRLQELPVKNREALLSEVKEVILNLNALNTKYPILIETGAREDLAQFIEACATDNAGLVLNSNSLRRKAINSSALPLHMVAISSAARILITWRWSEFNNWTIRDCSNTPLDRLGLQLKPSILIPSLGDRLVTETTILLNKIGP